MNILKITSLLCSLALIAGCASGGSSRSSESGADYGNSEMDEFGDPNEVRENKGSASAAMSEATPTVAASRTSSNDLDNAIRAKNNEAIHRAAISVLSQNPNDVKALNALGLYHYELKHYPAALMMFGRALKVNPNVSELHNNLGLVYMAQGEKRDAIKAFRRAIELNSRDANAAANIGAIYISEKDYTKALVALEIAYKKNNKDVRVLNNYGIALTAAGKYNEAKDAYKDAMKLQSSNKEVMLNYAILLIDHLKQGSEGLEVINKLRFLGPSPEARNRINGLENKAKSGLK